MTRVAVAALLALLGSAAPASAHLAEITTSVQVATTDEASLQAAMTSAVASVLAERITFTPTLVVLTHAVVVGDRLYIRLLVADREGEQTFRDLDRGGDTTAPDPGALRI
jgi:hypothetical protein